MITIEEMGPNDEESLTKSSLGAIWKAYAFPIVLGTVSLILIVVSVVILLKSTQSSSPIQFRQNSASGSANLGDATIAVDVQGAVAVPGLFRLPYGSRIEDAIVAAGGLTADADHERIALTINRATKLLDGAKLYIPGKSDAQAGSVQGAQWSTPAGTSINDASQLVNINQAMQSELEMLSGIGPVTAKKIISARPYQTLEELVTKKAMGQTLFNKLKDKLTL